MLTMFVQVSVAAQEVDPTRTIVADNIEIARLIDLCAQKLGIQIEYDPILVKGTVTLRIGEGLTNAELWAVTNRVLATRGLVTVQTTGQAGTLLSIVKIAEAAGLAGIEGLPAPSDPAIASGGFVNFVMRIEHQPVKVVVDAMKTILSKPAGTIIDLGTGGLVLISDLRSRVEDTLALIRMLDVPGPQPVILKIQTRFISGAQLASLITAASTAADAFSSGARRGKVIATQEIDALVLVCPPQEQQYWKSLIDQLDQRQAVLTKSYSATHIAAGDAAKLVEQAAKEPSPRGAGEQWRLVVDELTGTLIITATAAEHEMIADLMQRLESLPAEARRPMRVFVLRNRAVREIIDVVTQLLDAGVLEPVSVEYQADNGETAKPPTLVIPGATTLHATSNPPEVTQTLPQAEVTTTSNPPSSTPAVRPAQRTMTLTADEGTNSIIATADGRLLGQLEELIRKLDVRQPQVMIEVLIVSLSDTDSLDVGVELRKLEISGATLINLSSLFGLGTPGSGDPPANIPAGRGFSGVVLSPGDFSVVLRALQTMNRGRVLSLPKVLVNNNQQATLNSILQQPFVSVNASNTVATTSFGGSENAGTIINIKPQIAEGDHLILQYSVSLSSFVGASSDPALPPPKQSNNLSSLVTIPDGYTVVVGGLEITNESSGVSQVPLLGSIPIIGEAFKNRSSNNSRARFYVFIRSDVMRHSGFEDLKYVSDQAAHSLDIDDGWPDVQPRIIR